MKYLPQIVEQSGIVTKLDALQAEVNVVIRLQAEAATELDASRHPQVRL